VSLDAVDCPSIRWGPDSAAPSQVNGKKFWSRTGGVGTDGDRVDPQDGRNNRPSIAPGQAGTTRAALILAGDLVFDGVCSAALVAEPTGLEMPFNYVARVCNYRVVSRTPGNRAVRGSDLRRGGGVRADADRDRRGSGLPHRTGRIAERMSAMIGRRSSSRRMTRVPVVRQRQPAQGSRARTGARRPRHRMSDARPRVSPLQRSRTQLPPSAGRRFGLARPQAQAEQVFSARICCVLQGRAQSRLASPTIIISAEPVWITRVTDVNPRSGRQCGPTQARALWAAEMPIFRHRHTQPLCTRPRGNTRRMLTTVALRSRAHRGRTSPFLRALRSSSPLNWPYYPVAAALVGNSAHGPQSVHAPARDLIFLRPRAAGQASVGPSVSPCRIRLEHREPRSSSATAGLGQVSGEALPLEALEDPAHHVIEVRLPQAAVLGHRVGKVGAPR
jgi:hypothetical protein